MTLRLWQAALNPARLIHYRRLERTQCLPMLYKQPGFLGALFLYEATSAGVLTLWEDSGSAEALSSSPSYRRLTRELTERGLLFGEPSVAVWDVQGGTFRLEAFADALGQANRAAFPER